MKLAWGSVTEHVTRTGVTKFRARDGTEARGGLGIYDTREAAEIACDEAHRATIAIGQASGTKATFAAFGRAWLDREEKAGIRRALKQERARFAAHLERAPFALFHVATIEQRDVQQWLRELVSTKARGAKAAGKTISRETAKRALALFRSIMRTAVIDGIADANPGAGVVVPRGRSTKEKWTWLTQAEIDRVLALDVSVRRRSIFAVAIFTGLRAGELYGLHWEDVLARELVVRHSRGEATKGGHVRRVPLLAPARQWLDRWRGKRKRAGLVWPAPGGSHHADGYDAGWASYQGRKGEDGTRRVYPGARELAGITREVRFHDLRHTCGSHLVSGTAWTERGYLARAAASRGGAAVARTRVDPDDAPLRPPRPGGAPQCRWTDATTDTGCPKRWALKRGIVLENGWMGHDRLELSANGLRVRFAPEWFRDVACRGVRRSPVPRTSRARHPGPGRARRSAPTRRPVSRVKALPVALGRVERAAVVSVNERVHVAALGRVEGLRVRV